MRILSAAAQVIATHGYGGLSPARVVGRAGVSRRTFYDIFENREDCFLALFDDAVARASSHALEAAAEESSWRERVRAGLGALLELVGDEPVLGSLLITEALRAGPQVLAHRTKALERAHAAIDGGRSQAKNGRREPPPLTAEGTVGAVLAVLHARMLQPGAPPPLALLNPLMGMIVLPYLGPAAAAKELTRPTPKPTISRSTANGATGVLQDVPMRITYRTLRVLATIAEHPGISNRQIAEHAGVKDQGQISKLLTRLQRLQLIDNTGTGATMGEANAWHLTPKGHNLQIAMQTT